MKDGGWRVKEGNERVSHPGYYKCVACKGTLPPFGTISIKKMEGGEEDEEVQVRSRMGYTFIEFLAPSQANHARQGRTTTPPTLKRG